MTQSEVARRLGKPRSFVSEAETEERRLDFLEVGSLATIYGVELDYFRTL